MKNDETETIYMKTWKRDGVSAFNYAIEEMVELIQAICKFNEGRGSIEHIAREVADVQVTVGVLGHLLPEVTKEEKSLKLIRLDMLCKETEMLEKKQQEK